MSDYDRFTAQWAGIFNQDDSDGEDEEMDRPAGSNKSTFEEQWGWIYSVTKIAEHERIKLDDAYDLPIVQAFNDLAYLKDLKEHEIEMNKEQQKQIKSYDA